MICSTLLQLTPLGDVDFFSQDMDEKILKAHEVDSKLKKQAALRVAHDRLTQAD
jgi:hypothetical protein